MHTYQFHYTLQTQHLNAHNPVPLSPSDATPTNSLGPSTRLDDPHVAHAIYVILLPQLAHLAKHILHLA